MSQVHTSASLARDLQSLGISHGDLLFVHSSFKRLGQVDGGAQTVVNALTKAVGQAGLILMPSFNLLKGQDLRAETWRVESTPSTVGWLTEYFRQMPGTHRSDHYSHSVAARGPGAKAFVADHRDQTGLKSPWDRAPWGRTYGDQSPLMRAYDRCGKLLMLGVDYHSSTYVHLVEVMYWNGLLAQSDDADFVALDRVQMGKFWDRAGGLRRGMVGDAESRCFGIKEYVDELVKEVYRDADAYDRVKLKTSVVNEESKDVVKREKRTHR